MWRWNKAGRVVVLGLMVVPGAQAATAGISGSYSAAANDRFASGYPSAPVRNTDPSFIGLDYDWSGVSWAQEGSPGFDNPNPSKSFGLVSPRHHLIARHFSGAGIHEAFGSGDTVITLTQSAIEHTLTGIELTNGSTYTEYDLSIGTFTSAAEVSDGVAFYPVLDLGSPGNYEQRTVWLYGHDGNRTAPHQPRILEAVIEDVVSNSGNGDSYFLTSRDDVILQTGDSGSPVFIPWTDPEGNPQLTIAGIHAASEDPYNYHSFLATDHAADATNGIMNDDGYVLKWVADIGSTWQGDGTGNDDNYDRGQNWSTIFAPGSGTYAGFDSDDPVVTAVDLNGSVSARGWIFKEGASAFSFSNGTASIDRGGILNYDSDSRQSFSNGFVLTDNQWWEGGGGGLSVSGSISLSAFTLVVTGSGDSVFSGAISGTGQLAKEGDHTLTLSGTNTYSGGSWIHRGTVIADATDSLGTGPVMVQRDGALILSSGTTLGNTISIQPGGKVAGEGTVNSALTVGPGAVIAPGSSPGTLGGAAIVFGQDGIYEWEINDASGAAGDDPGWDTISLSGSLDISATGSNPFVIDAASLTTGNVAGDMGNFDSTTTYRWVIVSAAGGIANFERGDVVVDASGITNAVGNGVFTVTTASSGTELVVRFIPEGYPQFQWEEFTDDELDNALVSGPAADYEGDGITNFEEYAFSLQPKDYDASALTGYAVEADNAVDYLTIAFQRLENAPDIEYRVEVSAEVAAADPDWTLIASSLQGAAMTAETGFEGVVLQDTGTGVIDVKVRDNLEFASQARRFIRARAVEIP